jgi:acetylornithine deacetylase/succinyl-diaminopimelate desuccinylase-like protein
VAPVTEQVERLWEADVLPVLSEYTAVPCLSPAFEPGWADAGHLDRAADLLAGWCATRPVRGLSVEVHRRPGLTPLLVAEVPGPGPTVLLYGHLDKQPPLGAWREGLGPFEAVREGDRLYGRGTADDGYAVFCALGALELAAEPPHTVVVIEASEESGSPDLPAHLDRLDLEPALVVCLDSGALSYDRLWVTTSLRGVVSATVTVEVLTEGVHSGLAGGAVPSSFRLLRRLLSRVEDETDGRVLVAEMSGPVPEAVDPTGGSAPALSYPVVEGVTVPPDALFRRSWRPALEVIGMDGVPPVAEAGNVLRPSTTAKLSFRIAPSADPQAAAEALARALAEPVEGARVTVALDHPAPGWVAPPTAPWLDRALDEAGRAAFGAPPARYGEGGTIPFLAMLAERFAGVQFVATGVLGPESNAHGPNEFLHLPTAKALTAVTAHLLDRAREHGAG